MKEIYRITVCGRNLESRDLRALLARAVAEKRTVDRRLRTAAGIPSGAGRPWKPSAQLAAAGC